MVDEVVCKDLFVFVILDFVLFNCLVYLNQYYGNFMVFLILMGFKLFSGDNVCMFDERLLNDIEWFISVYEGLVMNEYVELFNVIGMFNYYFER